MNWNVVSKYGIGFLSGFFGPLVSSMFKGEAPSTSDFWVGLAWGLVGTGLVKMVPPQTQSNGDQK